MDGNDQSSLLGDHESDLTMPLTLQTPYTSHGDIINDFTTDTDLNIASDNFVSAANDGNDTSNNPIREAAGAAVPCDNVSTPPTNDVTVVSHDVTAATDDNAPLLDQNDDEAGDGNNEESDDGGTEAMTCNSRLAGCLAACLGDRLPEQKRLLLMNVIIIVWSALTAGLSLLETGLAHGQCMIGMPLSPGGLDPRNVKKFYCKCPLYTVLLAASIAWLSIMVNWVSDLHSKRAVFYKWVKYQAMLTFGATVGVLCSVIMTILGFIKWCGHIQVALDLDDDDSTEPIPKLCFNAARMFDKMHPHEFVKLYVTFLFSVGITILIILHCLLWCGANFYTLRLLRLEPRDNFNLSAYQRAIMAPLPMGDQFGNPRFRGTQQERGIERGEGMEPDEIVGGCERELGLAHSI